MFSCKDVLPIFLLGYLGKKLMNDMMAILFAKFGIAKILTWKCIGFGKSGLMVVT